MNVDELLQRPYHIQLVRDQASDGQVGWMARVVELPGCLAQGDTPGEASNRIYEAMAGWFQAMLEDGEDIPEPAAEPSASGRVLLRLPETLHERLSFEAEREGVSLNQFAVGVLAASVGWRHPSTSRKPRRLAASN